MSYSLSSLGSLITHRKGFAFKSKDLTIAGHPIVKVSNFTNDSINMNGCFFIANKEASLYSNYQLRTKDIVIATVGSWPSNPNSIVGKVVQVPKSADGALLNQNSVILRSNGDIDQAYLYYRLKSKDFSDHLISGARGSANQASISLEDIFRFEIALPSLPTQQKIAFILSVLDDKIELNRQMNETLEETACTIFKEWFVKFN